MKSLLPVISTCALAIALTGCAGILPASPTPAPTGTPQTALQTVVVTVVVTQLITTTPQNTATATLTPIPTFTSTGTAGTPAVTASAGTPSTAITPATGTAASPSATLPADAGGGLFTSLTRSSDHFGLTCQPNTITFAVSTSNPNVKEVDLFYRMENQSGSSISGWVDIGKMASDKSGNFTMDFPATRVDPDLRNFPYLDYQFVGLDGLGQVVGRSAKIVRQVTFGCPG